MRRKRERVKNRGEGKKSVWCAARKCRWKGCGRAKGSASSKQERGGGRRMKWRTEDRAQKVVKCSEVHQTTEIVQWGKTQLRQRDRTQVG